MNEGITDESLLSRAIGQTDRTAIDLLIRRYADLVHGVAMRQIGDSQLAADVSQAVFIVFIRKLRTIHHAHVLPRWFFTTTQLAVRDARRAIVRRRHHEFQAARPEQAMNPDEDPRLSLIDQAIASLGKTDRDLILMRYMQGREMETIALDIGISEQSVRKRISRAIERMRRFFETRNEMLSIAGITNLLLMAGDHVAPPTVIEQAGSAAGIANATVNSIAQGTIHMMTLIRLKIAAALILVGTLAIGVVAAALQQTLPANQSQTAQSPATAPADIVHPAQAAVELYLFAGQTNDAVSSQKVFMPGVQMHLDDAAEMIRLNGPVTVQSVIADDKAALVISSPISDPRARVGVMLVMLNNNAGKWLIQDIDFERPEGLQNKLASFHQQHPAAKELKGAPTSQPATP